MKIFILEIVIHLNTPVSSCTASNRVRHPICNFLAPWSTFSLPLPTQVLVKLPK